LVTVIFLFLNWQGSRFAINGCVVGPRPRTEFDLMRIAFPYLIGKEIHDQAQVRRGEIGVVPELDSCVRWEHIQEIGQDTECQAPKKKRRALI
jgi:hypothetical protein